MIHDKNSHETDLLVNKNENRTCLSRPTDIANFNFQDFDAVLLEKTSIF